MTTRCDPVLGVPRTDPRRWTILVCLDSRKNWTSAYNMNASPKPTAVKKIHIALRCISYVRPPVFLVPRTCGAPTMVEIMNHNT